MAYGDYLGINGVDNTEEYSIIIYPNPSQGRFYIATSNFDSPTRVTINTIEGKQVKAYFFKSSVELNNYNFDLTSLSKGVYFINLENASGTGVKRIILE
jgi:hypothetical protein